jgi:hypothetical protein
MAILTSVCLILFFSLIPASGAVAGTPVAVPVDGDPFRGVLISADSKGLLVFETKDGRKELPASELVRWGTCLEPDPAPVFLLRDGTLLVAGLLEAGDKNLAVDSDSLGLVRLPREQIAAVVFRLPGSRLDRDRLIDEAIDNDEETTRVVMLNGDRMRGELAALEDRNVSLRTAVGPIDLELDRVSTLTFPSTLGRAPGSSAVVGLADGSRVCVKHLAIGEQTATMELLAGLSWKADAKEIVFLQPASPRIVYLSDLMPSGYRHVPYLDRTWQYRNDRNVLGGLMRCGGRLHLRGLGMHTAARISYVLPENAREFQAGLGIDDGTEGMGSVRFRVFVDGNEKYVSPTVRGFDTPIPISVEVQDAVQIDLVVDFADRADVQDHANWLDARFMLGE